MPVCICEGEDYPIDKEAIWDDPMRIVELARTLKIHRMVEEYLYMLMFDSRFHLIAFSEVSHGTSTYSLCDAKAVFRRAVAMGAESIILIHNHPSGDPEPSERDIEAIKHLAAAGKVLDISVEDHVIVTDDKYRSFREMDLME